MDDAPPHHFRDFIAYDVDRFSLLHSLLQKRKLDPTVAILSGCKHLIVSPGPLERSRRVQKPTVLIAHYDRTPNSPGANDNAAAVFQLMETAAKLRAAKVNGWLAIFTDKEEAAEQLGAKGQGAYGLAEGFKSLGLGEAEFFIFDACGRGDTIIVSTAVDQLLANESGDGAERTRVAVRSLRLRALEAGRMSAISNIFLTPTPFSDDAGFLAAGLAAQTITVLPAKEAAALASALRRKPRLATALLSKESRDSSAGEALQILPETWRLLHGPQDNETSLTSGAFPLIGRFIQNLVRG